MAHHFKHDLELFATRLRPTIGKGQKRRLNMHEGRKKLDAIMQTPLPFGVIMFDAITLSQHAVLPVSIDPQESAVVYIGPYVPHPPIPPKFSIELQASAVVYISPGSTPYPPIPPK